MCTKSISPDYFMGTEPKIPPHHKADWTRQISEENFYWYLCAKYIERRATLHPNSMESDRPTEPPTSCISISCSITAAPTSFLPHPTCLRFMPSRDVFHFPFIGVGECLPHVFPFITIHCYEMALLCVGWVIRKFRHYCVRRMRIDFDMQQKCLEI